LIQKITKAREVCFDTETTGLNPLQADIVGMSFSVKPHEAYFILFPEEKQQTQNLIHKFKPFFENKDIEKIGQNIKYDINVLRKYDIDVQGKIFDTMLAHYLIQPDLRHNMDYLAEVYLNYKPVSLESLIGKKGKKQKSVRSVPPEILTDYACEDADITLQLKDVFEKKLKEEKLDELFFHIETPLTRVLSKMEYTGIKLDVAYLHRLSEEITEKLHHLTKKIYQLAGEEFNIDSPKQLGVILFEKLQIVEKPKKTKTGQYATGEDVLSKLSEKHEIIPEILEYRMLKKLKSTYVDALPKLVDPDTQRIHTTYMQTVAATGRLSSVNPNLQNIPVKTELGREIRKAFIATNDNYEILAADYSQIELRIIASLAGDEHMIRAFKNNEDIHTSTAAKVFGIKPEEVTRELRTKAKAVNFGIIYGQSAFGLSQSLNISRTEAKEIIDNYFKQFPKIKQYIDNVIEEARKNEYVTTILGRKRYLKDINSKNAVVRGHAERNAINAPIQGSAADIIKKAMIEIDQAFEEQNLQTKMVLQVHDELVFDVPLNEKQIVKNIVKNIMENTVKLKVPLKVDMNFGKNWLEAH
ncbi:MAG: DNA polymerase I, partial [Bacteroidetes bacterium]